MIETVKNLVNVYTKSDEELIKEIHGEFDTAQDRLLEEANRILNELKIPTETQIEERAKRLVDIGFESGPTVKQANTLKQKREATQLTQIRTQDNAELIQHYKQNYPFQKFLTVEELDRICRKYHLIYAPVSRYEREIPEKNLVEIENVTPLKKKDVINDLVTLRVKSFWSTCPREIRVLLRGDVEYTVKHPDYIVNGIQPYESDLQKLVRILGYTGSYDGYIFHKAVLSKLERGGLFICAPKSHFNLKGLKKKGLGSFSVISWEVKDPIVFRYCRGGIQLISKWGLEASDPALINEIEN